MNRDIVESWLEWGHLRVSAYVCTQGATVLMLVNPETWEAPGSYQGEPGRSRLCGEGLLFHTELAWELSL